MVDGGEVHQSGEDDAEHPIAIAARKFLEVSHGKPGKEVRYLVEDAAPFAYQAAFNGALGNHDLAEDSRDELGEQLTNSASVLAPLQKELRSLWSALTSCHSEGAGAGYSSARLEKEAIEDLVLGHLCAYSEYLQKDLVKGLVQQVGLGQGLMDSSDRHVDMSLLLQHLKPSLAKHSETTGRIATESCNHLMTRSETLAEKLLLRLDLNKDGYVSEEEFMSAAPHALAIEIENLAMSAGVQSLIADVDFADDFHMAMAAAMGITGEE